MRVKVGKIRGVREKKVQERVKKVGKDGREERVRRGRGEKDRWVNRKRGSGGCGTISNHAVIIHSFIHWPLKNTIPETGNS